MQKGILGDPNRGPYSVKGRSMAHLIGKRKIDIREFRIEKLSEVKLVTEPVTGQRIHRRVGGKPYILDSFDKPYSAAGNSVCFAIQTAHLMGCEPIYLMGFTLQTGSRYFFKGPNPATKRPAFYDAEPPLEWCRFYESQFPGRVKLLPGWEGPIYSVFATEEFHGTLDEPDQDAGVDAGEQ